MADDEHLKQTPSENTPLPDMETESRNDVEPKDEDEETNVCTGLHVDETFHGMIPMEDLSKLLKENGAYLIRTSELNDQGRRVFVTVSWNGKINDYEPQQAVNGGCTFDKINWKTTLVELIEFHYLQQIPINEEGVMLIHPIKKESWELNRENITCGVKLGEGAFGEVFKGRLKLPKKKSVVVAIKIPKATLGKDVVSEAMKEARIQKDYLHPNVVRLYGVSAELEPLLIILEFVGGGSLESYLKRKSELTSGQKAMFCFGMLHFNAKDGCCFRCDEWLGLPAHNELYSSRHCCPKLPCLFEVLKTQQFAKPADIWALGHVCPSLRHLILLFSIVYWEIFTNAADVPFKEYTLLEVQQKLTTEAEFHPQMPEDCLPDIKKLVRKKDWDFMAIPGVGKKLEAGLKNKRKKKTQRKSKNLTKEITTKEVTTSKEQLISKEQTVPSNKGSGKSPNPCDEAALLKKGVVSRDCKRASYSAPDNCKTKEQSGDELSGTFYVNLIDKMGRPTNKFFEMRRIAETKEVAEGSPPLVAKPSVPDNQLETGKSSTSCARLASKAAISQTRVMEVEPKSLDDAKPAAEQNAVILLSNY
ncbi:Tyrosine-protein kinase [Aphelenchoides besseyi]|nr:Tyrosine-protein kinase [Aphelenchoides besseyi]